MNLEALVLFESPSIQRLNRKPQRTSAAYHNLYIIFTLNLINQDFGWSRMLVIVETYSPPVQWIRECHYDSFKKRCKEIFTFNYFEHSELKNAIKFCSSSENSWMVVGSGGLPRKHEVACSIFTRRAKKFVAFHVAPFFV